MSNQTGQPFHFDANYQSPAVVPPLAPVTAPLPHAAPVSAGTGAVFSQQDLDYFQQAKSHAPAFKLAGRQPLFIPARLLQYVDEHLYSGFLKKDITTLVEAINHDYYIAQMYADEDAGVGVAGSITKDAKERLFAKINTAIHRGSFEWPKEVTDKQTEWENAVASYREMKRQWDVYLTGLKESLDEAKLRAATSYEPKRGGRPRGATKAKMLQRRTEKAKKED